jgi:cellulose synthase operon protein YhjQ
MSDRKTLNEQNDTPEDVATLYSWANLHGAKYRDFSASRAQTREKARLRVQEAIEDERRRGREEADVKKTTEEQRRAEAARAADASREADLAAQAAARQLEMAAQQSAQQAAQFAAQQLAARQSEFAAQQAAKIAAQQAVHQVAQQDSQEQIWQKPRSERFSALSASIPGPPAPPYYPAQPTPPDFAPSFRTQGLRPTVNQPLAQTQYAQAREETAQELRNQWPAAEPREAVGRPAWLTGGRPDVQPPPPPPAQVQPPPPPEDPLQGSRDRMTSRWFALRGVFEGGAATVETVQTAPSTSRAPVMAVFSLAGGVGKTSLVATLGRALAARGEKVLLVDTAAYGLLPFFFGARDQRSGTLRTFSPPGASGDAPIQMVAIDPDNLNPEAGGQEALSIEIGKFARGAGRVIIDLATASGATTRRVMRMSPLVLVPVIPDMNSVVSVSSIEAFFQHNSSAAGKPVLPNYVLNQFDPSIPLHLDIREVLREQLGDRLLPFAIRRASAVSEALAEGMTVMDYAPNSSAAEDFGSLAAWVKTLSSPAGTTSRGVRSSER